MEEQQAASKAEAYKIEGDLTIYRVAELRDALLQLVGAAEMVAVDLPQFQMAEHDAGND